MQVHTSGGDQTQVRQRGPESPTNPGPKVVGGEDLDEISPGFVCDLRLGGRISTKHDGPAGSVCQGHQLRPANGTDHKLGAGSQGSLAGGAIENCSNADPGAFAKMFACASDGLEGIRRGHGDFDGRHSAGEEGLGERQHLVWRFRADHGDDTGIGSALR